MANAYLNDTDEDFGVFVKSVLALPHVKIADIQDTVQLIDDKEWPLNMKCVIKQNKHNWVLMHIYIL